MPENYIKRHWAECSACGYTTGHAPNGNFLSPFFLPSMCAGCGQNMTRDRDRTHWNHIIQTRKRVPPVRTRNPLTWLRGAEWAVANTETHLVF